MINNYEQIKLLLQFDSMDDFYHLQILKRKKEHPELGSNSYVVKTYYIKNINDLDFYFDEIVVLCNHHNARACINLNRRSFERTAFHTLSKVTECLLNRDYASIRNAYDSATGKYAHEKNKKWIIDIDHTDCGEIFKVIKSIDAINPPKNRHIATIPTKNGVHLITEPFNIIDFNKIEFIYKYDIHKNNPTILYIP